MAANIEQAEGVSGIKLEGPQADRERQTGQTAASGNPQVAFEHNKKQDFEAIFKELRETQLTYSDKIPEFGLDSLQINDLIFAMPKSLTPPTAIRIDKDMINYRWHTLRTNEVQKVTSGHSNARIHLSLYFVGLDAINSGLRRLLAVFDALPFVFVENSFIRKNLTSAGDGESNMACSLVSIAVRTEPQTPNVLVADLTLLWFNYKPFATNFWFRKSWNSVLETPRDTRSIYDKEILAAAGGPQIPSENDITITEPLTKGDQTAAFSPPATVPQDSDPLKQLVDSHEGELMTIMDNKIEIGFREYRGVSGFHGGVIGVGKINEHLLCNVRSGQVKTSRDVLLRLHPEAAEVFEQLTEDFARMFSRSKRSRRIHITSCYRTRAMQLQLQRTQSDVASRGYSWHEVGLAFEQEKSMPGLLGAPPM
jgi:hypothetical protein